LIPLSFVALNFLSYVIDLSTLALLPLDSSSVLKLSEVIKGDA
jgi:hypothetical protein